MNLPPLSIHCFFLSCLLRFVFNFFVHQIPPEPLLPPRAIEPRLIYARQCVRQDSIRSTVTFGSPFIETARTQDNHARMEAINVIDVRWSVAVKRINSGTQSFQLEQMRECVS